MLTKSASVISTWPILATILLVGLVTACVPRSELGEADELSAINRIDRGVGPTDLTVTVLPFTDSLGRVYRIGPEGRLQLLEGVVTNVDEVAGPINVDDGALQNINDILSADVHIVGVVGGRDGVPVLISHAVHPRTGDVIARSEVLFDVTTENGARPPIPEGLPTDYLPLSPAAVVQAHTLGGIRQHELQIGPRGGWLEVFRRILGGAIQSSSEEPEVYPPFDDPPDDTPPPEIFGEEIDANTLCRVKLQCRWALANQFFSLAPGFIVRNYHCGWYTFISTAEEPRLGVHVQQGAPQGGNILTGHVEARIFDSDRGFQELSWAFKFLPYDSQRDGPSDACDMVHCIRNTAWQYHLLDARPYRPFGQNKSNSNSFIGSVRNECVPNVSPPPPFNNEGRYAGLHYWQRVGRSWRNNQE